MILAFKPFWVFFIITFVLLIVLYLYTSTKNVKKVKNILNKNGKLIKKEDYYILKMVNKEFYIKLINAPEGADVQINNKDTWQCFNKNMSNSFYIKNMTRFMNLKKQDKIIIFVNKVKTVKLVINESEMIMVNNDVDVYGTRVYKVNEINLLFK